MANVKCPSCGKYFDKNKIEYYYLNGRYYHRSCCDEDTLYREKIFDYLKKIWGICSKPKIGKQIDTIIKSNGYFIKEIYLDLQYFYDIKGSDTSTYKNTINIVPYIHDEAQRYYKLVEYREQQKEKTIKKLEETQTNTKTIYVDKQPKRKKILFELEIEEEEE